MDPDPRASGREISHEWKRDMRLRSLASTAGAVVASLWRLPAAAIRLYGSLRRLNRARLRAAAAFEDELRRAGLPAADAKPLAEAFPRLDLGQFTGERWRTGSRFTVEGSKGSLRT